VLLKTPPSGWSSQIGRKIQASTASLMAEPPEIVSRERSGAALRSADGVFAAAHGLIQTGPHEVN
jgi:hypothetical protein